MSDNTQNTYGKDLNVSRRK